MSGITNNDGKDRFFSATYRVHGNKRKSSTKTSSEGLARRISTLWYDIECGVYTKKESADNAVMSLLEVLESKLPEAGKDKERALKNFKAKSKNFISERLKVSQYAIEDLVIKWLQTKERNAASTYSRYETDLSQFLEFLGEDASADINDFQRYWLSDYATELHNHWGVTTSTVNGKLKSIKMFLKHCYAQGYADIHYGDKWQRLEKTTAEKRNDNKRRKFTDQELQRLYQKCDEDWKDVVAFAINTGQRLGDIVTAKKSQFNFKSKEWKFYSIKRGRVMEVPVSMEIKSIVERRSSKNEYLFPKFAASYNKVVTRKGRKVRQGATQLSNIFNDKVLHPAGFAKYRHSSSARKGKGKRGPKTQSPLCFHSLRHTAASMMHEAGMSERVVKDIIGHDSDAVHNAYVEINIGTKNNELDKLPTIFTPAIDTKDSLNNYVGEDLSNKANHVSEGSYDNLQHRKNKNV